MATEREVEPVSEFIRFLIDRWERDGKKLYVLAEEAGLAKSMPSQIKARTSDASFYSARKLARPFGYEDLPDLVAAAWRWWSSPDRLAVPGSQAEAPLAIATRLAESYGVTKEQVERVLRRYPLAEFEHQDGLWWLSKFHEERALDAGRAAERRAEKKDEQAEARARKKQQAEIRAAKEALQPPAAPSRPKSPKRRAS